WEGWAILLRQKQKKLIMLPSETMIWQPEFTDKTLSRKPGAVQNFRGCIRQPDSDRQLTSLLILTLQPESEVLVYCIEL
ncbi:hypothetical protein MMR73_14310, partial [Escherichia coli]|nr:hypothetical protein [Escherichia coli]